jgi:hypothetical protein
MFAMPFFAFKGGLFYAKEGYEFEYNEEYDYTYKIEGAEKAILEVVEVPLLFQFHYDTWNFKFLVEVGCYGGYRLGIQRFPGKTGYVKPELEFGFKDTDRRFDYGIKGGVGLALVFDPLEFHITAAYKHSLSSLYAPDHNSQYYYRFAYPSNIVVSAGVHFQLSKRTGKTKANLDQPITYGMRALLDRREQARVDEYIFPRSRVKYERSGKLSLEFKEWLIKLGILSPDEEAPALPGNMHHISEKSFHSTRKSVVTAGRTSGIPADVMRTLVGHNNKDIHEVYVDLQQNYREAQAAKIEDALLPPEPEPPKE